MKTLIKVKADVDFCQFTRLNEFPLLFYLTAIIIFGQPSILKKFTLILFIGFFAFSWNISAQNTFGAQVKSNGEEGDTLSGAIATVLGTELTGVADSNGIITIHNIPAGEQAIEFSYLGYFKKKIKISFPQPLNTPVTEIKLQSQALEVDDVVIASTRNYQKAEYDPIQVDVMDAEDVEQESHDKPSDVSHILREQPGVQMQRTSATSGTMGIRLQGLSSDYVQVLKDGFPLFGGFSNVVGITQIPPLDLQQVEILKGPESTLYGGDAIAGVINLISKQPTEAPVYDVMFNGESANAYDAGFYASQKIKWFAFSLMGTYRYQKEKDWSGFGFAETPLLQRYTISPQLFFDLSKHARLNIGSNFTNENRTGGSDAWFAGTSDSTNNYYEKNVSKHISSNFKFEYDFGSKGTITIKNAVNSFNRNLQLPWYLFAGTQLASASEINYHVAIKQHDVVVGIDARTDKFAEGADSSLVKRSYNFITFGFFVQYMYHFDAKTTLEAGFRLDYNNVYKVYPLPHIAVLRRWNEIFSTRINFGMGYKLPTIFQAESEEARFINVLPITTTVKPELSFGGTFNWKAQLPNFNGVHITINQLYFFTQIVHPLIADTTTPANCPTGNCVQTSYANTNGYTQSAGVETGFNLKYRGLEAGLTYTLTDTHNKYTDILNNPVLSVNPLTSKHIVSIAAGYSIKNFFIGIDCYYYSPVKLEDGSTGKQIWEVGISTQYAYKFLLLFANIENIADIRQTSFGPVVYPNPTYAHPLFSQIYGPLEGRLFNAGIKIHLGYFAKKKNTTGKGIEKRDD